MSSILAACEHVPFCRGRGLDLLDSPHDGSLIQIAISSFPLLKVDLSFGCRDLGIFTNLAYETQGESRQWSQDVVTLSLSSAWFLVQVHTKKLSTFPAFLITDLFCHALTAIRECSCRAL